MRVYKVGLLDAMSAVDVEGCRFEFVDCSQPSVAEKLPQVGATVIYCFLLPPAIVHLSEALWAEVQRGARVVTCAEACLSGYARGPSSRAVDV